MKLQITRVSYILSQFPETHETFIVREIREMERQGVSVEIFSLKKCRDKIVQNEAVPLKSKTHYPGFANSVQSIFLTIYFLLAHPGRMAKIFLRILKDNYRNPVYLVKTLAMIPAGVWIGHKSQKMGVKQIHAHWATIPTETAWIASKAWGLPYSFTAHAWDIFLHPGNLEFLIDDADQVITCTRFNKSYMNEKFGRDFGNKIMVTYHGLDFSNVIPKNAELTEGFYVLAIGRLVEQKGFSDLLKAVSILKNKGRKLTLWLVGEGPLRGELEEEVHLLNIRDDVVFKGVLLQQEVFSLMRAANVLVMPSVVAKNNDRDGIPNVILEAMAHRLPVIGTDVSGLPEVIIDHVTGLLVPPEAPEDLAAAIETLMKVPAESKSVVEKAKQLIEENFDIHKNVFRMRKELGLV